MNRKSYPSDLTDAQWKKLSSFLPTPQPLGSPLKWEMCLIINAIFYSDNQIAIELLTEVFSWYITIQLVCADAAYRGELEDWLYLTHQCQLEIAPTLGQQGFEVIRLRWIVVRTFSWLAWFRRLTLDCEHYPKTAETMVYIAYIYLIRKPIK